MSHDQKQKELLAGFGKRQDYLGPRFVVTDLEGLAQDYRDAGHSEEQIKIWIDEEVYATRMRATISFANDATFPQKINPVENSK